MSENVDTVLSTLLDKKIELLKKLLLCSQKSLMSRYDLTQDKLQKEREELLQFLVKNDSCISVRERQLGRDAKRDEKRPRQMGHRPNFTIRHSGNDTPENETQSGLHLQ